MFSVLNLLVPYGSTCFLRSHTPNTSSEGSWIITWIHVFSMFSWWYIGTFQQAEVFWIRPWQELCWLASLRNLERRCESVSIATMFASCAPGTCLLKECERICRAFHDFPCRSLLNASLRIMAGSILVCTAMRSACKLAGSRDATKHVPAETWRNVTNTYHILLSLRAAPADMTGMCA